MFIAQVAVRACEELEFLHVEVASENRLVSLYLHLLLIFSATTTWRLLQQEHLQPLRPALNKLTQNIMAELVTKGIYHTLQVFFFTVFEYFCFAKFKINC